MSTKYLIEFSVSRRKQSKKRKKIKLILIAVLAVIFFSFIFYLFWSGIFSVKEIKVENPENLMQEIKSSAEQFIDSQSYFLRKNSIFVDKKSLSDYILAAFPVLDNITVKKSFFTKTIIITGEERKELGIYCQNRLIKTEDTENVEISENKFTGQSNNLCFWFDKNAVIFREALFAEGSLILRITDERKEEKKLADIVLSKEEIEIFQNFKKSAKEFLKLEISQFTIDPQFYPDLVAESAYGFKIYFEKNNYSHVLLNLKEVLNKELAGKDLSKINYFDGRVENRIYYKFK